MKTTTHRLTVLLAGFLLSSFSPAGETPVQVTYIANAGFLIEAGESKVLVDALFNDQSIQYAHVPSDETLEKMAAAEPPFDNVDLILVTHRHRDHFEAGLVADFLASSPETILVAPPQAVESLEDVEGLGARVRSIHPDLHGFETVTEAGIQVKAYRLNHSAYMETDPVTGEERDRHEGVQNLVYVVELAGRRILHTGDAVFSQSLEMFENDLFHKVDLDLVFVEFFDWSEETARVFKDWMTPDHIVFMHLPREQNQINAIEARLQARFPQAVLFLEPMEVRGF
ncbi:MAG: MBL fold metallo-hydrolase [bacterium]|nr:MBL fold metallo-hydrolase [bacterium]